MDDKKQKYQTQIQLQERYHQRWTDCVEHRQDGSYAVTEAMSTSDWIGQLKKTGMRLSSSEAGPTKTVNTIYGTGYQLSALGAAVWDLCDKCLPYMDEVYPTHIFHPYIAVLLRAIRRWAPALKLYRYAEGSKLNVNERVARVVLDRLFRFVRRACRTKQFKMLLSRYERNEKKNLRSVCGYMRSIFAVHSRPLIVRLDIYYLPEHKQWADTLAAARGVEKFLRALREDRIVKDVLGWIAKRENGSRRGVHYHVMVIVDGHKHREAGSLTKMLGDYWVEHCTGPHKLGSYFNCYTRKNVYEFNALGLLHVSDWKMLLGLREALIYMVKGDHKLKTGHTRNLWRGLEYGLGKKRGAPRKPEHDMSWVDEILNGEPGEPGSLPRSSELGSE